MLLSVLASFAGPATILPNSLVHSKRRLPFESCSCSVHCCFLALSSKTNGLAKLAVEAANGVDLGRAADRARLDLGLHPRRDLVAARDLLE